MNADEYGQLCFFALYRAPNQFFYCITDGKEGTPLLYMCDRRIFMFSRIDREIYFISKAACELTFASREGRLPFEFGLLGPGEPSKIMMDMKPVFGRALNGDEARPAGMGRYRLTRKVLKDGTLATALVDPSRKCPFTEIELSEVGDKLLPTVQFQVAVDEDVPDPIPAFPEISTVSKKLPVKDLSGDFLAGGRGSIDAYVRCLMGHAAVRNMKARAAYESTSTRVRTGTRLSQPTRRYRAPFARLRGRTCRPRARRLV